MVDVNSDKDVPPRVLELLRIFLAASSRGEEAVFVLETRQKRLTTKFMCMENVAGNPATTSTSTNNTKKQKVNPATARISRLSREETFNQEKVREREEEAKPDARNVKYSFKSEYAEEDIVDSFQEVFPECEAKLEARVAITPLCKDVVKELVRILPGQYWMEKIKRSLENSGESSSRVSTPIISRGFTPTHLYI